MKNRSLNFIYLCIAMLYAFLFSQIPEYILRDRINYLDYALDSKDIFFNYLNEGLLSTLSNEPLFLGINMFFKFFFNPEIIPSLFSFLISTTLAFFLLKEVKGFWLKVMALLYLTFIPLFFHMQLVILRQSLALAILLIVMMVSKKDKTIVIWSFILGFIHTSFFVFFIIMFILYISREKKISTQIILVTLISFLLSASIFFVGNFLGARQAGYYQNENDTGSSLFIFVYFILLCLLLARGESVIKSYKYNIIAIAGLVAYLSLYFIAPFAGRLICSFLPFIVVSLLRTNSLINYAFIIIFLLLNLFIFKKAILDITLIDDVSLFFN